MWEGQLDPVAFFPDTQVGNAGLCRYVKLHEAMPEDGSTIDLVKAQQRALKAAYSSSYIYDRLKDVQNPTLMVVGTFAGEGPASYDLLDQIPTSMVVGFSDAAHGAVFQHSKLAAAAISDFLDSEQGLPQAARAEE